MKYIECKLNLPHRHPLLGVVDFRTEEEEEEVDQFVEEGFRLFSTTAEMLVTMCVTVQIQRENHAGIVDSLTM